MDDFRDISIMNEQEMQQELEETQRKLQHVSKQIAEVDRELAYLRLLFRTAVKNEGYAARYNLRMQLSILSGVKVMYNNYASVMESRANDLMAVLPAQSPRPSANSDHEELIGERLE